MVVIGAGIVGSAIAMHLAEGHLDPVVVDPGRAESVTVARDLSQRHARAMLGQAARFLPVLRGARIARTLLAWRSMPADRLDVEGLFR